MWIVLFVLAALWWRTGVLSKKNLLLLCLYSVLVIGIACLDNNWRVADLVHLGLAFSPQRLH